MALFDAIICAAGDASFKPLIELSDEDFTIGLDSKLMGQVNLVRSGLRYINDSGSFTLISSMLAVDPMPGSAAVSLDNAGLNGFVRAAALEFPRGVCINVLSPPWVRETFRHRPG